MRAVASNASGAVKRPWNAGLADEAGRDAVDPHAVRRQLLRERLGQRDDGALRGRVREAPGPPPLCAASDDTLTIAPERRATMPGAAACVHRNALVTFTSITDRKSASSISVSGLRAIEVAGVVDQHVQGAQRLDAGGHHGARDGTAS